MDQSSYESHLGVMIQAAKEAGDLQRVYFGEGLSTAQKSTASDLRTKADVESEETIIRVLKEAFPDYSYNGEETGYEDTGHAYTFAIDPLDGTNNFVLGIPFFSVSIGLLKDGEIVAGVIYHPMLDDVYSTFKGGGAFLNGNRISVNEEDQIKKSSISYVCGYEIGRKQFEPFVEVTRRIPIKRELSNWSIALDLALLASGKIESVISNGVELHDIAAGKLLVKEAGGRVTTLEGEKDLDTSCYFLATNGALHEDILAIWQKVVSVPLNS